MFSSDVKLKKTEENKKKTKRKQKENKKKSKRRTANRHRTSSCQPEPPKELCVDLHARHPELLVVAQLPAPALRRRDFQVRPEEEFAAATDDSSPRLRKKKATVCNERKDLPSSAMGPFVTI